MALVVANAYAQHATEVSKHVVQLTAFLQVVLLQGESNGIQLIRSALDLSNA